MKYQAVLGLEIHIELATKSKMFCSCSADYFMTDPNTHTCPICLGLPGAMPASNKIAIEYTQKLALALNCQVKTESKFDRKNYFYPDLPKGFQISQYDLPFSQKGFINIDTGGKTKKIGITRVHLEEDTGKLSHAVVNGRRVTLIDFNRSGVPLVEVVSEPDINSASEAKAYAQTIQQIARYLGISDADMEKGSMRIEPNISLRKAGETKLPNYKVELKNINSFKFAQKAIDFEIERQKKLLDLGKTPVQETRGFSEKDASTYSQRGKEVAHDYRYFPEPDIPPFNFEKDYLSKIEKSLPEMPDQKRLRFAKEYQLTSYDNEILTRDRTTADYFEEAVKVGKSHKISPKTIANAIINQKIDPASVLPARLIQDLVSGAKIAPIDQAELTKIITEVISKNPKAVKDYQDGKENAIMFLVGQVVRKLAEKSDPLLIRKLLIKKISKYKDQP